MRTTPILLVLLLLFQSCSLYKGSITLEEAVASEKQVKVTSTEYPKPLQFKKIEQIDGQYVGLPKRYSSTEAIVLQKEKITKIKEHDKTASNIVNFTPLVLIATLGIILFADGDDGGY
ncbi:MAG: hypothetical protein AAF466_01430 [Bacteroidota bacterium]